MLGVGWSEELALEDFGARHEIEAVGEVFGEEPWKGFEFIGLDEEVDGTSLERGGTEQAIVEFWDVAEVFVGEVVVAVVGGDDDEGILGFGGEFGELFVEALDAAMSLLGSGAEVVHSIVWLSVISVNELAIIGVFDGFGNFG